MHFCVSFQGIIKTSTLDIEDMISACETQEFVPFGRRYIENHPGIFQIQVQNHVSTEQGIPLVKSFRDISITDLKRVSCCVRIIYYNHDRELPLDLVNKFFSSRTKISAKRTLDVQKAV